MGIYLWRLVESLGNCTLVAQGLPVVIGTIRHTLRNGSFQIHSIRKREVACTSRVIWFAGLKVASWNSWEGMTNRLRFEAFALKREKWRPLYSHTADCGRQLWYSIVIFAMPRIWLLTM